MHLLRQFRFPSDVKVWGLLVLSSTNNMNIKVESYFLILHGNGDLMKEQYPIQF